MEKVLRRLTESDYRRSAVPVAKALLGTMLCRRLDDGTELRARITETEAYCGEEDTACHAHKGRTPRTDVMYAPGGCAYIYLCYGMHEMLNVVTGPAERPEAVLIRGVEGAEGPGRLTKHMRIDRSLNRVNLITSDCLWIETNGKKQKFTSAPRIGIGYASKRDQLRNWRFFTVKEKAMKGNAPRLAKVKKLGVGVALALALSLKAVEPLNVLVPVDWVSEPCETQVKELR